MTTSSFFHVHRDGLLRVSCLMQQAMCEALGNAYIMLATVLACVANQWVPMGPSVTVEQVWWIPIGIICVLVTITAVLPPPREPRDVKGDVHLVCDGSSACNGFQRYDRSAEPDCYVYEHCGY
jgi:hypothetical protein